MVISGIRVGDTVANLAYCKGDSRCFWESNRKIGYTYSGTGDVLASVLCGCLTLGYPLGEALRCACRFIGLALEEAAAAGTDPREGILFEPFLKELPDIL